MATNTITADRVREILGKEFLARFDLEVDDLVRSANAGPDESAGWLPYYKLALVLLANAYGRLGAALDYALADLEALKAVGPRPSNLDAIRAVARSADGVAALHLVPCVVGDDPDPDRLARARATAAAEWESFDANRRSTVVPSPVGPTPSTENGDPR